MKLAFLSNFYNHHQSVLCNELYTLSDGQFRFIATEPMGEERRTLGYSDREDTLFVRHTYDEAQRQECLEWIEECDVLIIGSAPQSLIKDHIKKGKPLFRYAEHPLKKGAEWSKYLPRFLRWHSHNMPQRRIYLLCASAYAASDYRRFGLFANRTYKWGYFPETRQYDDIDRLVTNKTPASILWCGRFLDWKHPDDAVAVVKRLRNEGYDCTLTVVGTGAMEEELHRMAGDEEAVRFTGSMPPDKVREHMERSSIYLFTSDRHEGWGAVLGEAMNSACAVVACADAGSSPYLITHGENGMLYRAGDHEALYRHVKALLDDSELCDKIGKSAYRTMTDTWNAKVAAARFWKLATAIVGGEARPDLFASGPCSRT